MTALPSPQGGRSLIFLFDRQGLRTARDKALVRGFVCNVLGCSVQQAVATRVGYRFFDGETRGGAAWNGKQCPLVLLDIHTASRLLADLDSQLTVASGNKAGPSGSTASKAKRRKWALPTKELGFASKQMPQSGSTKGGEETAVVLIGPVPPRSTQQSDRGFDAALKRFESSATVLWLDTHDQAAPTSVGSMGQTKVVPLAAVAHPKPSVPFEILLRCLLKPPIYGSRRDEPLWQGPVRLRDDGDQQRTPTEDSLAAEIEVWPLVRAGPESGWSSLGDDLQRCSTCRLTGLLPSLANELRTSWYASEEALSLNTARLDPPGATPLLPHLLQQGACGVLEWEFGEEFEASGGSSRGGGPETRIAILEAIDTAMPRCGVLRPASEAFEASWRARCSGVGDQNPDRMEIDQEEAGGQGWTSTATAGPSIVGTKDEKAALLCDWLVKAASRQTSQAALHWSGLPVRSDLAEAALQSGKENTPLGAKQTAHTRERGEVTNGEPKRWGAEAAQDEAPRCGSLRAEMDALLTSQDLEWTGPAPQLGGDGPQAAASAAGGGNKPAAGAPLSRLNSTASLLHEGPTTEAAALDVLSSSYRKSLLSPPSSGGGYHALGDALRLACRHIATLGAQDPCAAVEAHAAAGMVLPHAGVNAKYGPGGSSEGVGERTKLRELQLQVVLRLELARLRTGYSGQEAVDPVAEEESEALCGLLGAMPMLMDKTDGGNFANFLDEALAGLFLKDFPVTVEAVYEELEVDMPEQLELEEEPEQPSQGAAAAGVAGSSPGGSRLSAPFGEDESLGGDSGEEEDEEELPEEGEPLSSPLSLRGRGGPDGRSGNGSTGAGRGLARHSSTGSLNLNGNGPGGRSATNTVGGNPLAPIAAAGLPRAGPPKKFIEKKKFKEVRSKAKKVKAKETKAPEKQRLSTSRGLFRDLAGRSHSRCSQSPVMTDFHVTETPMKAAVRRRSKALDDDVIPESPPMKL